MGNIWVKCSVTWLESPTCQSVWMCTQKWFCFYGKFKPNLNLCNNIPTHTNNTNVCYLCYTNKNKGKRGRVRSFHEKGIICKWCQPHISTVSLQCFTGLPSPFVPLPSSVFSCHMQWMHKHFNGRCLIRWEKVVVTKKVL